MIRRAMTKAEDAGTAKAAEVLTPPGADTHRVSGHGQGIEEQESSEKGSRGAGVPNATVKKYSSLEDKNEHHGAEQ